MKRSGRKIVGWVCVCAVLLALVLWLVPLPLPFHMSLSGVRVEGAAAAEPAALEAEGWRLCRFLRTTELRASFTVETAQGAKTYEPAAPQGTGGGAFGKNRKSRRKSEKIFPKGVAFLGFACYNN